MTTTPRTTTSRTTAPRTVRRLLAVLLAAVLVGSITSLTLASPATASHGSDDDDRVIRTGSCTGGERWKLKVKTDDGRLEVEGEVDSNVSGQKWAWRIKHNGSVSAQGTSTTTSRSGSFSVERKIVDLQGTDRVVFKAVRNGHKCRGVINY
jgi:hypothetical protein